MDVQQLFARFEAGVRYTCGCEEQGLHPAVVRGIMTGAVPARILTRCPQHAAPLQEDDQLMQVDAAG